MRSRLKVIPYDSSDSSDSSDSMYRASPGTPQFHRVMRDYIRHSRNHPYGINIKKEPSSPDSQTSTRSMTYSEYERKIKCENNCVKKGCLFAIIAGFCGVFAL